VDLPTKTATDEAIERISRLRGPNKAQRGALLWMAGAFANIDTQLQRRSARIARRMQASLQDAFPEMNRQFIGDVVADLDSLWDLRQRLDKDLKRLFQMRFPLHRNHLYELLIDIQVRQLDEASYLIRRLRSRIPKLLGALDKQEQISDRSSALRKGKATFSSRRQPGRNRPSNKGQS
jgi:hypothetical protein